MLPPVTTMPVSFLLIVLAWHKIKFRAAAEVASAVPAAAAAEVFRFGMSAHVPALLLPLSEEMPLSQPLATPVPVLESTTKLK